MPIAKLHFRISVRLRCGLSKVRFVGCARRLLRASERGPWSSCSTRTRARCRLHLDTTPNGAPGARGLLGTCRCVRLSSVPPPVTSAETEVRAVRTQVHALSERKKELHQTTKKEQGREAGRWSYCVTGPSKRGRGGVLPANRSAAYHKRLSHRGPAAFPCRPLISASAARNAASASGKCPGAVVPDPSLQLPSPAASGSASVAAGGPMASAARSQFRSKRRFEGDCSSAHAPCSAL